MRELSKEEMLLVTGSQGYVNIWQQIFNTGMNINDGFTLANVSVHLYRNTFLSAQRDINHMIQMGDHQLDSSGSLIDWTNSGIDWLNWYDNGDTADDVFRAWYNDSNGGNSGNGSGGSGGGGSGGGGSGGGGGNSMN